MTFHIRWGILATGWIAEKFTRDLLIDPSTRDTHDVQHSIAAVASSSGKNRAEKFKSQLEIPATCNAYGSYEELVQDPSVDIVYVASPHSHHFEHTMLALEADKHVVCEKPITVNVRQAKVLYQTAKAKNLFLLDAVWTRYFPLSVQIRDLIKKGTIGEVLRVIADTSMGEDTDNLWKVQKRRKVNMDLAGGVLLESIWNILPNVDLSNSVPHTSRDQRKPPDKILSHMAKYAETGVDEDTTVLISFPTTTPSNLPGRTSHGVGMTSFPLASDPDERGSAGPAIRIQGTKGEIQVYGPAFRPERYRVIPLKQGDQPVTVRDVWLSFPADGHGMYYEADEAARCVRDGKIESETMPWEESILVMETMDEVRKQCGLVYPEEIESATHAAAGTSQG